MRFLFIVLLVLSQPVAKAQTITASAHNPLVGTWVFSDCDSTSTIPKNMGANQTWDFSTLSIKSFSTTENWVQKTSSTQYGSNYPAANMVLNGGFYNTNNDSLTYYGAGNQNIYNPQIIMKYPFSFGSTFTDKWSRDETLSSLLVVTNGTVTVSASGSGTITLPGSYVLENVLQVTRILNTQTYAPQFPTVISYNREVSYEYFHSQLRRPFLTIHYFLQGTNPPVVFIYFENTINVGLRENKKDLFPAVFPNPTSDQFTLPGLTNLHLIKVIDAKGNDVTEKITIAGDLINMNALPSGLYIVNVISDKTSANYKIVKH